MADVDISVVIPAYNESKNIRKCIKSIESNENSSIVFDITVVDNASSDETVDIVENMGYKVIKSTPGETIGSLRNLGAKHSTGNIIVFLDADMIVPPHFLKLAKEYFDSGFEGALGFVCDVPSEAGWVGKTWGKSLRANNAENVYVDFLNGGNIFVNRRVFDKVGGFSSTLITGEDKDFTFRIIHAGYKVISLPHHPVTHSGYERSLWEFIKKEYWRQGFTLDLARNWGYSFRSLRNPLLSFWHVFFALVPLFALFFSFAFYAILISVCFWILPSILIARQNSGRGGFLRFSLPFFFLTFLRWNISGLALLGQVFRIIQGKRYKYYERV